MNGTQSSVLELHYWDADRPLGRAALLFLTGLPAAACLWLLFLCVNQLRIMAGIAPAAFDELQLVSDPSSPWEVIGAGIALLSVALPLLLLATRFALLGRRSARGTWWLRLSPVGFEVNDRIWRPRRYRWSDIHEFFLVCPDGRAATGPVPQAQTVNDVIKDGEAPHAVRVGFRYLTENRRRCGRQADGYVMDWWDRPFDEAVELMNEWLVWHR